VTRVGYVTSYDARDVRNWSGIGTFIAEGLEAAGLELERIGPLRFPLETALKARQLLEAKLRHRAYLRDRQPLVTRSYARQVSAALAARPCDVVLATGSTTVGQLPADGPPLVIWTGSTLAAMEDFYPTFSRLTRSSRRHGHALEGAALRRAAIVVCASDWAARSAREDYGCDPARVRVVPFGANLADPPVRAEVEAAARRRLAQPPRFLFVGTDWERKRGPLAVAVVAALRAGATDAQLDVVGPRHVGDVPDWVHVHGYLDKRHAQDMARLRALYAGARHFLVPTAAEAYGVAFVEAHTLGTPSVSTDVGGVATIIRHDVTGCVLPVQAGAGDYAAWIAERLDDDDAYVAMALAAYDDAMARLNWPVATGAVADLVRGLAGDGARRGAVPQST
jgi:glycosyltransferase involved in cell wall biosynthesis